jgi:hypothetical protein
MIIKNLTQLNALSFRVCLRILFVTNKNMGLSLEDYQRQRVKSLHLHLHKIIGFRLQISEGIKACTVRYRTSFWFGDVCFELPVLDAIPTILLTVKFDCRYCMLLGLYEVTIQSFHYLFSNMAGYWHYVTKPILKAQRRILKIQNRCLNCGPVKESCKWQWGAHQKVCFVTGLPWLFCLFHRQRWYQ